MCDTSSAAPQLPPEGEQRVVSIGDLATEAGVTIRDASIAFRRWGAFRGDPHGENNVLVVEHALTGDSDAADWWCEAIGPGKALDTDEWCVICTNALGSCYGSTGPASEHPDGCLLYTSPSPRDRQKSRMPSSA